MRRLRRFFEQSVQRFQGQDQERGAQTLQQQAFSLPLLDRRGTENRSDSFVKHCLESPLREC